jgi:hypothetical protein
MDISKFNEALRKLVGRAKRYEKAGNLEEAIEAWLRVSEFTLRTSKQRDLDSSYRNMLISRTEGIINKIKVLKGELNKPKVEHAPPLEPKIEEKQIEKGETSSISQEMPPSQEKAQSEKGGKLKQKVTTLGPTKISREKSKTEYSSEADTRSEKAPPEAPEVIEDSEFKNLPNGVKQIKPSKDIEVLTPFDSELVKRRLGEDIHLSGLEGQENTEADEISKKRKIICSVCGEVNSAEREICKNCGTKLKK